MKKTNVLKISLLFVLFLISVQLFSQRPDMRYRRLDDELVKMERYEADTTANALILGDYGVKEIRYNKNSGFQLYFTRHLRIKIFNRDAFDLANFEIPLYRSGSSPSAERLSSLKAVVFTPENGKINRTRFRRREAFTEEVNDYLHKVIFTLPNVREGSVIDLEYTVISPFLQVLNNWHFQSMYPTVFSELRLIVPEYFTYKPIMQGYFPLTAHDHSTRQTSFTVEWEETGHMNQKTKYSRKVEYVEHRTRYRVDSIPAFTTEPYMNSPFNYLTKVEHELEVFRMPFGRTTDYSTNWIKVNKQLMESDSFGKQLESSRFIRDEVEEIASNNEEALDRLIAAHSLVQNEMVWNNTNSKYIRNSLRDAWRNKEGNSADINMLLVLVLKELGIEANPVILSTRANGMINPAQLMLSKYNYVIASAEIGGELYLLDATQKRTPYYILPVKCINGQGRLISETRGKWVDLDAISDNYVNTIAELKIHECGSVKVVLTKEKENYYKLRMVNDYRKYDDDEEYMDDFEAENQGIELVAFNIENYDEWSEPLRSTYEFKINEIDPSPKDIIYINPFTIDRLESNPFRLEERLFPVDFIYPHTKRFNITIEIPEGYAVDEIPRGTRGSLPRQAGSFFTSYNVEENIISVEFEVDLRKAMFVTNEYQDLQSFYSRLVEEQARQIVLKKL